MVIINSVANYDNNQCSERCYMYMCNPIFSQISIINIELKGKLGIGLTIDSS